LQVDLSTSSIRPGQPPAWQAALQDTLQAAVANSSANIKIFTGTWQHDVDQANLLGHQPHVKLKVCSAAKQNTVWNRFTCIRMGEHQFSSVRAIQLHYCMLRLWTLTSCCLLRLQVYSVESHRLALALQRQRKLAPLVREAVLQELVLQSGNVRLANLL
jgi:hypothetical protein